VWRLTQNLIGRKELRSLQWPLPERGQRLAGWAVT
jgi:hypothetical protein